MGTKEPPIKPLSSKEKFEKLWTEQGCLKHNLVKMLDRIEETHAA